MNEAIICGPILRRTTKSEVNIWIATEKPLDLTAVFPEYEATIRSGQIQIQLGSRLFSSLITITPINGQSLPENHILYYDILAKAGSTKTSILAEDDLGADGKVGLPSMIIGAPTKILTGSCRKNHSAKKDMLSYASELIKNNNSIDERPRAIFLTGDQIYADDVSDCFFEQITATKAKYFDSSAEEMPFPNANGKVRIPEDFANKFNRKQFASDIGLTSQHKENHLLLFSEYCSAYLLNWSIKPWGHIDPSNPLYLFKEDLIEVRRLLANISVYMNFDDHEVSDDFNINKSWCKDLKRTGAGERVLSNALSSYWIFQGMGNIENPQSSQLTGDVKNYIQSLREDQSNPNSPTELGRIINSNSNDWWYSVKFGNYCQILGLDTRMSRYLGTEKNPSGLIHPDNLEKVFSAADNNCENLIIISPAPYFGFNRIENIQNILGSTIGFLINLFGLNETAVLDRESWKAGVSSHARPRASYNKFKELLISKQAKRTLILSGDVHYGFVRQGKVIESAEKSLTNVWQITSSSLKNSPILGKGFNYLVKFPSLWYIKNFSKTKPNLRKSSTGDIIIKGSNIALVNLLSEDALCTIVESSDSGMVHHQFSDHTK